jgi:hypothetical protein
MKARTLKQRLDEYADDDVAYKYIGSETETWADEAFIGIGSRCGQPAVLVYDYDKLVAAFAESNDCDADQAREYIDYNILGAWDGELTPILLQRLPKRRRRSER